jgi:hypothetical protein
MLLGLEAARHCDIQDSLFGGSQHLLGTLNPMA